MDSAFQIIINKMKHVEFDIEILGLVACNFKCFFKEVCLNFKIGGVYLLKYDNGLKN